jgi:acyl-CoA synthetase (AMP-forming)/AMP-acid ligase II
VQVDPIKPTLKPPGIKRLKLQYYVPASNFAFKFNLRRYTTDLLPDVCTASGEPELAELWVSGPLVGLGYANMPQLTAERFRAGGLFRTGDVVRRTWGRARQP